jgi:hypothetical protein
MVIVGALFVAVLLIGTVRMVRGRELRRLRKQEGAAVDATAVREHRQRTGSIFDGFNNSGF